jgi:hypothetical protein
MKSLLIVALNILIVVFGCNLSPAPDYKFQGWREGAPQFYSKDYEKISIDTVGAFYNESGEVLEKGFCIGTTFETPETVLLESATLESGGNSYPAQWSNNTTLDGKGRYARKECGHLTLRWNLDRPQSEIFAAGAQIVFNLQIGGKPETVRAEIVSAADYKAE